MILRNAKKCVTINFLLKCNITIIVTSKSLKQTFFMEKKAAYSFNTVVSDYINTIKTTFYLSF